MNRLFTSLAIPLIFSLAACDLLMDKGPLSVTIATGCQLDSVGGLGGDKWTAKPGAIKVSGWALDNVKKTAPENVTLQINNANGGVVALSTGKRLDRSDVASHFKEPGYLKSGLVAEIDASKLPRGEYTFSVVMSQGNAFSYCAANGKLTIQ
jgi:hypothetical protein